MVKLLTQKPLKLTKSNPGTTKVKKTPTKMQSNELSNVNKLAKKNKKSRKETVQVIRALKEQENLQSLDTKNFKEGIRVLFELYSKTAESQNRKQLLDDAEEPIFLQVTAIKIPRCTEHTERIDLPHSYYPKDIEICLISSDLPNTNLRDYDKVIEHYENILNLEGISNIKTIMSFHQLRNEYQEFEMKRKLASAYNVFLADSKIHGKVVHFLGSTFDKARKVPRVLSFDKPNLKKQVERILSQTDVKIHTKGNSTGIQVGLIGMKEEHVLNNVKAVAAKLPYAYAGCSENIRSVNIKTTKSMAVPLYLTLKMKSEVEIPKLKPQRPNKCVSYTGDLSTRMNTRVTVLPSGHVKTKLKRTRGKQETVDSNENTQLKSKKIDSIVEEPSVATNSDNEDLNDVVEKESVSKSPETFLEEEEEEMNKPSARKSRRSVRTPKHLSAFKIGTKTANKPSELTEHAAKGKTPTTPTDKRKSASITNSGSKKKQRLIKNPFYKGDTSI